MNVWFLTADLMFSSRVVAHANRAGHAVTTIASPTVMQDRLPTAGDAPPDLVILDLTAPGLEPETLVPQIRGAAPGAKILAYGPHVHAELLASAQQAGCDQVMSNGQFNANLAALLC